MKMHAVPVGRPARDPLFETHRLQGFANLRRIHFFIEFGVWMMVSELPVGVLDWL